MKLEGSFFLFSLAELNIFLYLNLSKILTF